VGLLDVGNISSYYRMSLLHRPETNLNLSTHVCSRSELSSSNSREKPAANIDFLYEYSHGSLPTAAGHISGRYKASSDYKGC
jgi:hypothetical protein